MIKNILFYASIGLTIIIVFYYLSATSSLRYTDTTNQKRQEQQNSLSKGDSLKITKDLKYFNVNEDYITTARVVKLTTKEKIGIPFSKSQDSSSYERVATLLFNINNKEHQLTLFKHTEKNDYILPFSDSTNFEHTHTTGRYLPIEYHNQEYVDLDFNMAYNPYCAYDTNYSCAITPRENFIPLSITAGELRY